MPSKTNQNNTKRSTENSRKTKPQKSRIHQKQKQKNNQQKQYSPELDDAPHGILANNETLEQENDEGNVEYKWKLVGVSSERFKKLVTQMKFRLAEGMGEALYEIGIQDDGLPAGLIEPEFEESIETLRKMAQELEADVTIVCEKTVQEKPEKKKAAEALVRTYGEEDYLDLRIAACGNVDSGKSTLIGVLTRGSLDNGRGSARASVFTHRHEVDSGRTSSISHQIMGFDSKGNIVNYQLLGNPSWQEIVANSRKICTFIDLAGHEKYLKTTVFGMTGSVPDYSGVIVGANMGVTRMTKEHIGLTLALKVPMFFVVTKIDMAPDNVKKDTLQTIHKILKLPGVRKIPYHVKNFDDVVTCAKNIGMDRVVPIFQVSNVTGDSLDLLRAFLNLLPSRKDWETMRSKNAQVVIDQTFFVSGVGTVVSGIVSHGEIAVNDTLMLGPDGNGRFRSVAIKSIHVKRVNVRRAVAGQHASFALKKEKRSNIRKGMVLLEDKNPKAVWEFDAEVLVLYHSTTIKLNYQPVIHCMCVRQCAKIVDMDNEALRTGDKARVRFRFMNRPEYLREEERLIFREGRTKGIGMVKSVDPI
eukprot:gb/GECH01000029.1/.p1 GENE.gb/GECH01000029.1/~~gb/GECH01000029.1/.p1  ORF type:complete len:586 (+),score=147.47 gb/GECH01000029.1/:1-1758(+)